MEAHKQIRPFEPSTSQFALQAEIVWIPLKTLRTETLAVDESLTEFEWASRTSKTWDMGQD